MWLSHDNEAEEQRVCVGGAYGSCQKETHQPKCHAIKCKLCKALEIGIWEVEAYPAFLSPSARISIFIGYQLLNWKSVLVIWIKVYSYTSRHQ